MLFPVYPIFAQFLPTQFYIIIVELIPVPAGVLLSPQSIMKTFSFNATEEDAESVRSASTLSANSTSAELNMQR